jgi:pyruvate kinase
VGITIPKTKIVCTIGPASEAPETIRELITNGMRVARLNFSHGTHRDHGEKIHTIRKIAQDLGEPVAILQDLGGPKIRVGHIPDPGVRIEPGQDIILTTQIVEGSKQRISVSYPLLNEEVNAGDRILLADGFLELRVRSSIGTEIYCEVITGGVLTSHKGINLTTGTIRMPSMTDKDRSVTYAACVLADHLDAAAILAPTQSGRAAAHLSRFRPKQPVIAYTPDAATMRRLSLFRGIYPRMIRDPKDSDDVIEIVVKHSVDAEDLSRGDLTVITAGQPVWVAGVTNMIRVKQCR